MLGSSRHSKSPHHSSNPLRQNKLEWVWEVEPEKCGPKILLGFCISTKRMYIG